MAKKKYFAHYCPHTGSVPSDATKGAGYSYSVLAENIFKGTRIISSEMMKGWVQSQGQRENMLNPRVKEIGVGVARENGLLH